MTRYPPVAIGAGVAAIVTHGLVLAGVSFNEPMPFSTYQGFFWHIIAASEHLWSHVHGWPRLSHVRDFGQFFAPAVQIICPLIGFALFRILFRARGPIHIWKPLAIAILLAIRNAYISLVSAEALPWVEGARTILIVGIMVWSCGALTNGSPESSPSPGPTRLRANT